MTDETLLRRYWNELSHDEQAQTIRNLMVEESAKMQAEGLRQIETARREWAEQQRLQERQRQQAAQEARQQPRQSINEVVQQRYGLDRLPKRWNREQLANGHYTIDVGESMVAAGELSSDELAEVRRAVVLHNVGEMPPEDYARMRRSGELENVLDQCAQPDPQKSWRASIQHRQDLTNKIANWAHQKMSDAGAIDDAEFVSQLRKHRGIPAELLDANGDPAASDEYISAEMGAINLAKLQNVPYQPGEVIFGAAETKPAGERPDVVPESVAKSWRKQHGYAEPKEYREHRVKEEQNNKEPAVNYPSGIEVSEKTAQSWRANNSDQGKARIQANKISDTAEYAQAAKEQADLLKKQHFEAAKEARAKDGPETTLGQILDNALVNTSTS